jgi:hypothetical protein
MLTWLGPRNADSNSNDLPENKKTDKDQDKPATDRCGRLPPACSAGSRMAARGARSSPNNEGVDSLCGAR